MAHGAGDVVEVLDSGQGWVPARVLRRNIDGTYDVSVRLEETIHLGDVAAILSLLCSGSKDAKISAALRYYAGQRGALSLPGLRAYLTSVFKVIFEADPERQADYSRGAPGLLSAKRMGDATARRAFRDFGLGEADELPVDLFRDWYVAHLEGRPPQRPAWSADALINAAFAGLGIGEALTALAPARDADNCLSRAAFCAALEGMVETEPGALGAAGDALFDAFDADGDGTLDFAELGAGLSVVCGGAPEERVRVAFSLFDADGSNAIDPGEMARYLAAVFRVAFARDPGLQERVAAKPEELAAATAEEAFAQCDANRDGKLDYAEFRRWYLAQAGADIVEVTPGDASRALANGLRGLDPRAVFDQLAAFADGAGCLSRPSFGAAFEALFEDAADPEVRAVLDAAFDLFDADQDGSVDGAELAAGLGALCGGPRERKIRLCFDLFDADGDGYLDEFEVRSYLQAVYRLSTRDQSAEEMAAATAAALIREADADGDGRVSFDEFSRWVSSDAAEEPEEDDDETDYESSRDDAATGKPPPARYEPVDPEPPASAAAAVAELREARALLNLDHFSLDELVEIVVEAAPKGGLSARAFARVARRLRTLGGNWAGDAQATEAAARLAGDIFAGFDADGLDDVDFVEVAAGLATLAPASMDDKIEAAFALYDVTRGGVARPELELYLLACYRVLRACSATLAARMAQAGGPEALAADTAAACFAAAALAEDKPLDVQHFKEFVCEGISRAYDI